MNKGGHPTLEPESSATVSQWNKTVNCNNKVLCLPHFINGSRANDATDLRESSDYWHVRANGDSDHTKLIQNKTEETGMVYDLQFKNQVNFDSF